MLVFQAAEINIPTYLGTHISIIYPRFAFLHIEVSFNSTPHHDTREKLHDRGVDNTTFKYSTSGIRITSPS